MSLSGKRVLVTGGSRGIGRAVALALANEGANVAISFASSFSQAQEVKSKIKELKGECLTIQSDVSKWEDVQIMFDQLRKKWGGIDILINNAGIHRGGKLTKTTIEDWDQVINTNLKGAYMCSKLAVPFFIQQNWGRIINISSVIGLKGYPGDTIYSSAKAGLIGFTKSLAVELARHNITVNAVAPGFIKTDMLNNLSEQSRKMIKKMIPLARLGSTEEVANLVCHLSKPSSSYITGAVIQVDGGVLS